jgi:MFS family permease
MFAATAFFVAWFVSIERRHPEPIVPLHLFRNQTFLVANLIGFTIGIAMFGAISYLPTFVQTSLQTSATASGIVTTPQSLGVLLASVIGGQLITRTGRYRWQTSGGTALVLIAMLTLTQVAIDTPKWHVSASMVLLGLGMGLIMPTISLAAQNAVEYRYLGVATSSSQFFRQIGGVMGVAVFGVILSSSYSGAFDDNLSSEAKAGLPPAVIAEFDNPTIGLEEAKFAALQEQVRQLPDGEALLSSAVLAVREGVAVAVTNIFWLSSAVAGLCLLLTFFFKELPLRRSNPPIQQVQPAALPGAGPPPGVAQPAPEASAPSTAGGG